MQLDVKNNFILVQRHGKALCSTWLRTLPLACAGMDWHDLERMIKEERKAGNPVAELIHSLQLEANKATLMLSNFLDESEEGDDDAITRRATKVVVGVWVRV